MTNYQRECEAFCDPMQEAAESEFNASFDDNRERYAGELRGLADPPPPAKSFPSLAEFKDWPAHVAEFDEANWMSVPALYAVRWAYDHCTLGGGNWDSTYATLVNYFAR